MCEVFYCEYIPKDHLLFILGSALIETKEQKFKRKIAANPLIPLGTALTTGVLMVSVLILDINLIRKKNHLTQQQRHSVEIRKFFPHATIFLQKFRQSNLFTKDYTVN